MPNPQDRTESQKASAREYVKKALHGQNVDDATVETVANKVLKAIPPFDINIKRRGGANRA